MTRRRYFEDVAIDEPLGPLVRETSALQLLAYAGASRDYNLIHHDPVFARESGLPDTIVQGSLKSAFLGQLATDWAGHGAVLRQLRVQYRGVDVPGRLLTARGRVTGKRVEHDACLVECEVWLESVDGERTTRGAVVVQFPRRAET